MKWNNRSWLDEKFVESRNLYKDFLNSNIILYEGDINYRTVLFVVFLPIHAVITDEPALLLLKPSGKLKMKYKLKEYYFVPQDKMTFKLIKKGDNEYKYISNKFKISKNTTSNAEMLIALLKKFTIN